VTFVRESFIVFRRQLRMNLRNPAWVIIGALQPVLYLLLFGPLLTPLVDRFGTDNAYTFFVPGLLVQLGIFEAFFAGFSLIGEWREGVIEAERLVQAQQCGGDHEGWCAAGRRVPSLRGHVRRHDDAVVRGRRVELLDVRHVPDERWHQQLAHRLG
jgi:hypothetical protein